MSDKMLEIRDAHDKARNKAWREEPGTFDTLDAFKAGATWQAAQAERSVPVVGEWPHTMDAQVWARKWLEITADKPEVATDEGAMIGWFANAIMAGYDTAIAAEGEK